MMEEIKCEGCGKVMNPDGIMRGGLFKGKCYDCCSNKLSCCQNCLYHKGSDCRRYPRYEAVALDSWCGEWEKKK